MEEADRVGPWKKLPGNIMLATVTTSAQSLVAATSGASGSYPNKSNIVLRAPSTNTGNIHIGKASTVTAAGATTAGLSIEPGNAIEIPQRFASDASLIFVISSSGSQSLIWEMVEA
jgi:hypothetical protein